MDEKSFKTVGDALDPVAAASSFLIQVNKNQPYVPGPAQTLEAPALAEAVEAQDRAAVQAAAPEATSTIKASAAMEAQQLSSWADSVL